MIPLNQPNIVLITCDHLRADFLGCAGHPVIQTPHIDQLARRGVRFTQAYSSTPVCIPARASIMTGMEGHTLGLTEFRAGFELPTRETLPQQLSDAGYQTKVIGKMHVYPERCHYGFHTMMLCEEGRLLGKPYGENRGYDDYEQWLAEQGYPGLSYAHGMAINEYAVTPWHLPDHLHPTEWIGHQTCKEIKRRDWTRPLFMWASFTAPHPPLTPLLKDLYMYERDDMPKPYIGEWANIHSSYHYSKLYQFEDMHSDKKIDLAYRGYCGLVTHIDRQISRIIGTLTEEGILENTWIIITSDHGDNLGDHHLWQKANFLQGDCNVPLIVAPPLKKDYLNGILGPEWIPGTVSNATVGLQDVMPTCLDIGMAVLPDAMDGKSLVPLVKDPGESVREVILGEFGKIGNRSFMVTDGAWKYIWYEEDGIDLLFHIEQDPNELQNLASEEPSVLERYRNKLIQILSDRTNDPAVEGQQLKATSPDNIGNPIEKMKRFNLFSLHKSPKGLH